MHATQHVCAAVAIELWDVVAPHGLVRPGALSDTAIAVVLVSTIPLSAAVECFGQHAALHLECEGSVAASVIAHECCVRGVSAADAGACSAHTAQHCVCFSNGCIVKRKQWRVR